ncbi:MAG TPA: tetratricopeptide repeat protein [Bryobacteraceae bacterium]|nr:tetratricopeptide repeat protein [Bryobacteraceae bacterium]
MRHLIRAAALAVTLVALISCNRDPNVAKKRYLENGNKYFNRGKYREAAIMYKNALQKDMRYGEAYYRLALTQLKVGEIGGAVASLRRAAELLVGPANQAEHADAVVRLCEIYLEMTRDKRFLDEVDTDVKALLKQDPNSFDGHRLNGDLLFVQGREAFRGGDRDQGKQLISEAIAEYRKAEQVKPGEPKLTLSLARALAASGGLAEAESLYRGLIQKDKTQAAPYAELYQLYLFQKRLDDAEGVLKTAYANNPKQYVYLTMLAAYYYGRNRRDDMLRVLAQIKAHAKDYPQAYLTVGDFYLRVGDGEEAVRQYKEGIANDPAKKAAYQKRIVEVMMRQGKRAEAAQVNAQILKDNPKDNDARGLAAALLLDQGEVQKAISELQAVVTSVPDNFVARYNLGRAHVARGEWEQARQQFTEAIRVRPDYIPARLALGQLQVTRGEYDQALKSVNEILQLDPNNAGARLIESAALMGESKFTESQQLLEGMLKNNPTAPDITYQLGTVNLLEKNYREAEEAFRKAYQLNPANSRGLMGVVETYMAQDRSEDALKTLQDEVNRFPNRLDIRLALANTAVRAGKFDQAVSEFQKVLAGLPKNSKGYGELYLRLGETYRRKGDLVSAIGALDKARAALPDNPTVMSTLALALDGAGQKAAARQVYEQTLKLDPNNGIALNNLAFLIAETGGDLDQALTYAQRAKQMMPNMYEVSDTLGWIYLKKNLSDNAVEIFRDLVQKQPTHSTYRYHLGMALQQKGDKLGATRELQQALKDNPSKEEQDKIKQLLSKMG